MWDKDWYCPLRSFCISTHALSFSPIESVEWRRAHNGRKSGPLCRRRGHRGHRLVVLVRAKNKKKRFHRLDPPPLPTLDDHRDRLTPPVLRLRHRAPRFRRPHRRVHPHLRPLHRAPLLPVRPLVVTALGAQRDDEPPPVCPLNLLVPLATPKVKTTRNQTASFVEPLDSCQRGRS